MSKLKSASVSGRAPSSRSMWAGILLRGPSGHQNSAAVVPVEMHSRVFSTRSVAKAISDCNGQEPGALLSMHFRCVSGSRIGFKVWSTISETKFNDNIETTWFQLQRKLESAKHIFHMPVPSCWPESGHPSRRADGLLIPGCFLVVSIQPSAWGN